MAVVQRGAREGAGGGDLQAGHIASMEGLAHLGLACQGQERGKIAAELVSPLISGCVGKRWGGWVALGLKQA